MSWAVPGEKLASQLGFATLEVCRDVQGTHGGSCAQGCGSGGEQSVQSLGKLCQWLWSRGILLVLSGLAILGVEACGEPQM